MVHSTCADDCANGELRPLVPPPPTHLPGCLPRGGNSKDVEHFENFKFSACLWNAHVRVLVQVREEGHVLNCTLLCYLLFVSSG